jgi:hypothetical protein
MCNPLYVSFFKTTNNCMPCWLYQLCTNPAKDSISTSGHAYVCVHGYRSTTAVAPIPEL